MNRQQRLVDTRTVQAQDEAMSEISREEVDLKLAANKAEVDARLASFETVMKTGFADLRADLTRQDAKFDQLRSEMHKNTTDIIKWFVGAGLTFAAGIVAILTVVVNNAVKHPQAPAAAHAPSVLVIPPTQVTPPPAR